MVYEKQKRIANLNPNRGDEFHNPNRGGRFPCPNYGKEGGYPSPNEYRVKIEIPSFSGTLILSPYWIGFMK